MERVMLLSLAAILVVTPVAPLTVQCINGNCTKTDAAAPVFSLNIGSLFPFFGPVDYDPERDGAPTEDVIDLVEPPTNKTDTPGGIFSIHFMRVFSFGDSSQDSVDQQKGDVGQPLDDFNPPFDFGRSLFQRMLDDLENIGLLDLSGKQMTGAELYAMLAARRDEGRPVTKLVLSDSRIHPMDAGTFAAAESTISSLVLPNASVNLEALTGLTNLRELNLSNNALSTLPWYGLMANTLEVLDLSNNNYEEIRPELSMLKSLRKLYLSNNKIRRVEEYPLNLLPNLETLDLSMNLITFADLHSLSNLNKLNIAWNFLRLMGKDCRLPSQHLLLRLESNPWRCDCGLLAARDNNFVRDLDTLQCANDLTYSYCDGCQRVFLPTIDAEDRMSVLGMTKDSIEHLGCHDIQEFYKAISRLRQDEPEKFFQDVCLLAVVVVLLFIFSLFTAYKCCHKKSYDRKFWLKVQQIPHLEKIGKPQEVPYIKIDEPCVKA